MAVPNQDTSFGNLLKYWRKQRNFSQLDLALVSNVSQRHISFLESGRSNPSQEMVLQLATALDVPLRNQNVMLTTAGFPPIYSARDLSDPEVEPIRKALDFILRSHEPLPALIMDRYWNLIQHNSAAQRLMEWLIKEEDLLNHICVDGQLNLMRLMFHPQGLKSFVVNWEEIASLLIKRVYREALANGSSQSSMTLFEELQSYPDVPNLSQLPDSQRWQIPLFTVQFTKDELNLSFFSTVATLGTPIDITLQELRIESLYPADEITRENLVLRII